jgi:hypothetical protein
MFIPLTEDSKLKRIAEFELGDTVLWRAAVKDGEKTSPDYPGYIYKIYPETNYLGIYVFTSEGIFRFEKIAYSTTKTECWRKRNDEFTGG